jgi:hypothetical protein
MVVRRNVYRRHINNGRANRSQNPKIVPTPGVTQTVEIWVGFEIEGYGVNALGFCQSALKSVTAIVSEMHGRFSL